MNSSSTSEMDLSEFEAELISDDRRAEPRRVTLMQAEIKASDVSTPIACVVTDISKSGARVFFEVIPLLSDHVELLIHHPESKRRCEVCWTNGDEAGLRFID